MLDAEGARAGLVADGDPARLGPVPVFLGRDIGDVLVAGGGLIQADEGEVPGLDAAQDARPAGEALVELVDLPPLLRQAAGIEKGSGVPNKTKVGRVTSADVRKIAETKAKDLNAFDTEAAMKIVAGTARSMGITVQD